MNIEDLQKRALEIATKYSELNKRRGEGAWGGQEYMAGFVGDVGELSEIIMAKHGLRSMEQVDEKLAHELADCLWSILVLASKYDVNLEREFQKTMNELDTRIDTALAASS